MSCFLTHFAHLAPHMGDPSSSVTPIHNLMSFEPIQPIANMANGNHHQFRYFLWKWPLFHFWSLSPLKRGVVCGIWNNIKSIFTIKKGHYYANVTWFWNFQGKKKIFLIFAGSTSHHPHLIRPSFEERKLATASLTHDLLAVTFTNSSRIQETPFGNHRWTPNRPRIKWPEKIAILEHWKRPYGPNLDLQAFPMSLTWNSPCHFEFIHMLMFTPRVIWLVVQGQNV